VERLTIAGKISPSEKHLKSGHFQHRERNNKIKWLDAWLRPDEIETQLKACDVLILPYREATQSGVITLGIHHHCPMIITRVGGLEEQLPEGAALFCEPNPQAIAEAIEHLLKHPELYHEQQRALIQMRAESTWQQHAKQLIPLF
jgi:glycosyltransferase involved in cell wall biosynthesis